MIYLAVRSNTENGRELYDYLRSTDTPYKQVAVISRTLYGEPAGGCGCCGRRGDADAPQDFRTSEVESVRPGGYQRRQPGSALELGTDESVCKPDPQDLHQCERRHATLSCRFALQRMTPFRDTSQPLVLSFAPSDDLDGGRASST